MIQVATIATDGCYRRRYPGFVVPGDHVNRSHR
jgi:hypothetical protein